MWRKGRRRWRRRRKSRVKGEGGGREGRDNKMGKWKSKGKREEERGTQVGEGAKIEIIHRMIWFLITLQMCIWLCVIIMIFFAYYNMAKVDINLLGVLNCSVPLEYIFLTTVLFSFFVHICTYSYCEMSILYDNDPFSLVLSLLN